LILDRRGFGGENSERTHFDFMSRAELLAWANKAK
jgi:hypothetical protein